MNIITSRRQAKGSKVKLLVAGAALALAGTSSFALNSTNLTPGDSNTYSFVGSTDEGFAVTLARGDYIFSLDSLYPKGDKVAFEEVWVSTKLDNKSSNGNDFGSFNLSASEGFGQVLVHVTKKTDTVYLDLTGNHLAKGYSGTVTITPSTPVPEPSTMAMALAGVGLLGAVVRRRKIR